MFITLFSQSFPALSPSLLNPLRPTLPLIKAVAHYPLIIVQSSHSPPSPSAKKRKKRKEKKMQALAFPNH